jgi:WD40 repeat protein
MSSVVLRGHAGDVDELGFTPDNRWLISGSGDNSAKLWSLRHADLLACARDMAGRNLTEDEWKLYLPRRPFRPTFAQPQRSLASIAGLPQASAPAQLPRPAPGM